MSVLRVPPRFRFASRRFRDITSRKRTGTTADFGEWIDEGRVDAAVLTRIETEDGGPLLLSPAGSRHPSPSVWLVDTISGEVAHGQN